jgi:hypothetical protein
MATVASFPSSFDPASDNQDPAIVMMEEANGGNEEENFRRAQLRAKRESCMADLKRQLEASLDDMKEISKRLLTEIGTHVKVTHNVIYDYESVLETQQKEATRLEEVSKTVNCATNPFLETMMSKAQHQD